MMPNHYKGAYILLPLKLRTIGDRNVYIIIIIIKIYGLVDKYQ